MLSSKCILFYLLAKVWVTKEKKRYRAYDTGNDIPCGMFVTVTYALGYRNRGVYEMGQNKGGGYRVNYQQQGGRTDTQGKSQVLRDLGFILLPLFVLGQILKQYYHRIRPLHSRCHKCGNCNDSSPHDDRGCDVYNNLTDT